MTSDPVAKPPACLPASPPLDPHSSPPLSFVQADADPAMDDLASDEAYLSRQPILNLRQNLIGYELTLRDDDPSAVANTTSSICAAYSELGVRSALGRHKAFLRIDPEFLHDDDAIDMLPPDGVVIQFTPERAPDEKRLERCRALRERRYSLALADYRGIDEASSPLLPLVDFVRIDTRGKDARQLAALIDPLARWPLKLLAQGVDTPEDFARCRDGRFRFFQGNFFARPQIVGGRRLTASQATLLRLIDLVAGDADSARIEESFKHDPALAVNLLAIVNSVAYGLPRRIGSLNQAIQVLGRRQLKRWLYLLLMTPAGKAPNAERTPLLQMAALRARMLEILLARLRPGDLELASQAFITGLMSMMPAALGLPMDEILALLVLEREIVVALQSRQGLLGTMLALVESYDAEDVGGCDRILAGFADAGLDRTLLNACLIDSLRWINASEEAKPYD
ncbi:MAG: HDOD domain-containing protein [Candidatus Accumulibacter sp.]|jgi:EAL and modified HD-GYP domain-containing signal transduction protein|nr:HDOD domain-containing protein [Accumulibacter sp.]